MENCFHYFLEDKIKNEFESKELLKKKIILSELAIKE